MLQVQYNINYPKFTGRNVPIAEIAKAMGKDGVNHFSYGLAPNVLGYRHP